MISPNICAGNGIRRLGQSVVFAELLSVLRSGVSVCVSEVRVSVCVCVCVSVCYIPAGLCSSTLRSWSLS